MKVVIVPKGCSAPPWRPGYLFMSEEQYKRIQLRLKNKGMKKLVEVFQQ